MKKVAVLAVVILFFIGVISVFANGPAETEHKPLSKSPDKTAFQSVSDDISTWDDLMAKAQESSLRDDKGELVKRREAAKCKKSWIR